MPIIGVIDSSKSGNLYAASFDSIATVTVGAGGTSNVEFTNIPAGYTHLQIRAMAADEGTGFYDILMRYNNDSGANYAGHQIYGDGALAISSILGGTPTSSLYPFYTNGVNNGASSIFGTMVLDILDYSNTNKFKTFRSLNGIDRNGSGFILFRSGVWMSTNAITSIRFTSTNDIAQYSHFALYGIKVA